MNELPQDYESLYRLLALPVERLVRRKVKYFISREDAAAHIWVRLLAADVLAKFYATDRPRTGAALRSYVMNAAANHLANLFRTHDRRFNNEFVNRYAEETVDGEHVEPWEAKLRSPAITPERFAEVVSSMRWRWRLQAIGAYQPERRQYTKRASLPA